jgi:DNA-binding CsgD family transcriptional regulator
MLRAVEVRDAYRLIGECRDLGADPQQWGVRMLDGLRDLIGAPMATGGEGYARAGRLTEALVAYPSGLDAKCVQALAEYHRERELMADPLFTAFDVASGAPATRTRSQLVPDREYYRSAVYDKYYRWNSIEHRLASLCQPSAAPPVSAIHLIRPPGDRDFSARERRLVSFFHQELGPLVGRALVSVAEPGPAHLSPRLRQTLAFLLEGDSEKQVAARLGLSAATTHQYVTALYRHFGVRSRAQLMAYALKRARRFGAG